MTRRGCSAIGGCDDSIANGGAGCHLCDVIAHLPQRGVADGGRRGDRATRDGVADPKGGDNLAFKKRHRVGPHR